MSEPAVYPGKWHVMGEEEEAEEDEEEENHDHDDEEEKEEEPVNFSGCHHGESAYFQATHTHIWRCHTAMMGIPRPGGRRQHGTLPRGYWKQVQR